jgi:large exoprotein involved in heme utilization and adhesion
MVTVLLSNVDITTDRLTVRDGALVQSATFGSGDAGNIATFPSSIIAFSGGIPNHNVLSVPEATGKGGNITIATPTFKLTDGAIIAHEKREDVMLGLSQHCRSSETIE